MRHKEVFDLTGVFQCSKNTCFSWIHVYLMHTSCIIWTGITENLAWGRNVKICIASSAVFSFYCSSSLLCCSSVVKVCIMYQALQYLVPTLKGIHTFIPDERMLCRIMHPDDQPALLRSNWHLTLTLTTALWVLKIWTRIKTLKRYELADMSKRGIRCLNFVISNNQLQWLEFYEGSKYEADVVIC